MSDEKNLLSELESIAAGVAPAGTPLPHQLRDTSPPPMGDLHSADRERFDRWVDAQEEIELTGQLPWDGKVPYTISTIRFSRPVMVNRKFTSFITVVRGGRLDGRIISSSTRDQAIGEHERLLRRLAAPAVKP